MTTTAPDPSLTVVTPPNPTAVPAVASHYLVQCDECGEDPVIGTRYKSILHRNYDVCERCLQENHGGVVEGKFHALTQRVSVIDTRPLEPDDGTALKSITVYSLEHLTDQLNTDPTIGDITLYACMQTPPEACEAVKQAIAQHTGMACFHIYIRGNVAVGHNIEAIAAGLKENKSVVSVSWSIAASDSYRRLDDRSGRALQELMETNTTIQFMFVRRPRGFFGSARSNLVDDNLAHYLFDGLAKASLRTFRFVGHCPVSDGIKQKAWHAMQENPLIRRIEVKCENDDCQLDLLTVDKKQQWMRRWTQIVHPAAQQLVQPTSSSTDLERLKVLQEIQDSHLDTVPALYHFIRSHPGLFIET